MFILTKNPIITKENSPEIIAEYPILDGREVVAIEGASVKVSGLSFPIFLDASEIEHIENL